VASAVLSAFCGLEGEATISNSGDPWAEALEHRILNHRPFPSLSVGTRIAPPRGTFELSLACCPSGAFNKLGHSSPCRAARPILTDEVP